MATIFIRKKPDAEDILQQALGVYNCWTGRSYEENIEPDDVLHDAFELFDEWIEDAKEDPVRDILHENMVLINMLRSNYHDEVEKRLKAEDTLKIVQNQLIDISLEKEDLLQEVELLRENKESVLLEATNVINSVFVEKDCEKTREQLEEEIVSYQKEREELWEEIRYLNNEKDDIYERMEKLEKACKNFYRERETAVEEIEQLKQRIETANKRFDEEEGINERLKKETESLRSQLVQGQEENRLYKEKIIQLHETLIEEMEEILSNFQCSLFCFGRYNRRRQLIQRILDEVRVSFVFFSI